MPSPFSELHEFEGQSGKKLVKFQSARASVLPKLMQRKPEMSLKMLEHLMSPIHLHSAVGVFLLMILI